MDDGREFEITRTDGARGYRIWMAEYPVVIVKIRDSFVRTVRGFGATADEALARCYERLDDEGELDENHRPCADCGAGRRVHSVVSTYVPHNDKCPAMNDATGEET